MHAQIVSDDGWPVARAVLTLLNLTGAQITRAVGDDQGRVATPPVAAGNYTAVITSGGFDSTARHVVVPIRGIAAIGRVTLGRRGTGALPAAGTWTIDPLHSTVNLTAHHLGIGGIRGQFRDFSGQLAIAGAFERSTVHAELIAASLDTGNTVRDDNLRSAQFLDVEAHPTIAYHSNALTGHSADQWTVHGNLSLHGTYRPVDLDLRFTGVTDDPWGGVRAGFHASTRLRREDFAVSFNERLLSGIAQIGSTVLIELDIQAVHGHTLPWNDLGL